MAINLNKPISWQNATGDTATMLDELQPNILKGHVRDVLTALFLKFDTPVGARTFLKSLVAPAKGTPPMKSARAHLDEAKAFVASKKAGTPYIGVGITAAGYAVLGVAKSKQPSDPLFQAGMQKSSLADPAPSTWDKPFKKDLHAIVIVADAAKGPHNAALAAVRALIAAASGVTEIGHQEGKGQKNKHKEGIEHFGYVDGRSQPLFLTEDIRNEMLTSDGTSNWDPGFAPNRAILPDPAAPNPTHHFGSYFVFRKLEQNVRLFKAEEEKLAERLKLIGKDKERAGALIVGRFEDGTPATMQSADGTHSPVPNNFNYDSDPDGAKCPHFAHIRKVNPRGSGGFEPAAAERLHIMPRRGQTYGKRKDKLNDGRIDNKPEGEVGLLFMCFNVNLAEQFEFAQKIWANNASFPAVPPGRAAPGLDLVIGQGKRPPIECPVTWGADPATAGALKTTSPLPQAVTMKGGEYFFMPSLAFLRAL